MRLLILLLASCSGLLAVADLPSCYINNFSVTGLGAGTVRVQVKDQAAGGFNYDVALFIDNAAMNSPTDFLTVTSSGGTAVFTPSTSAWGTGSKIPKDGTQHLFYAEITNSPSFGVVPCVSGNGFPYKWNLAGGMVDFLYSLYTSVPAAGATISTLAVIVNVSDPYSIGSSSGGTLVCMVGGNSIYDNGVAGYYVSKYGISCSHVHTVTVATSGIITKAAMDAAYSTLSPALGTDEQFIALCWVAPFYVNNLVATGDAGTVAAGSVRMSVPAYFAYGGAVSFVSRTGSDGTLAQGQSNTANGMFHTASTTPLTDYGQRAVMMLAYEDCTVSCGTALGGTWSASFVKAKAAIDASFAARLTNPTAGKIVITSAADLTASENQLNTSLLAYGLNTGIAPSSLNVVTSTIPVLATFTTTGLLGYSFSFSTVNTNTTAAFPPGVGYGVATTSATGVLDGSSGQTQAPYWANIGAAFSCGSAQEPYGLAVQHYPDMSLLMSGYTRGMTAVESAWHSMRDPATTVCTGDPLNQPFSPSGGGAVTTPTFYIP